MGTQEEMQNVRKYKRKVMELRQTIRVLLVVLLLFVIATTTLAILLVWPGSKEDSKDTAKDAGRFEGEHRVEQYTIDCEYRSKTDEEAGRYSCTMDVLEFAGAGYENVAAAAEEYFSPDNLQERLAHNFKQGGMFYRSEIRTLECTRMDDTVVSIKVFGHFAEGGGFYIQEGKTFSVKTGKLLELDDILKDKKGFYSVIDDLILSQLPVTYPVITDACPNYKEIYQEYFVESGELPQWHLQADGLAFSFNDLQFLGRGDAEPCMMVVVPYELVSAYVKPEYIYKGE